MVSFFHSYDLRGIYPDEISEEEARKVGKAYGTFINSSKVLVGRDGRMHGDRISEAFIKGVNSTGTDVEYAGVVPTPLVYHGQVDRGLKSSAVVTASHNPPEYTGFKFCLEGALAMSREGGMEQMEDIYLEEDFSEGKGLGEKVELVDNYISSVKEKIGDLDLDVAVNCGNGVTGTMARRLFEELGCEVKMVNEEVDGEFPNHLPAPGNEKAQEQLKGEMASEELGVIFDGDGDRAGFVIPGYGYLEEDKVIALLAEECLELEKGTVVHDLRASKLVPEKIKEYGGNPEESKVGHTFISERIHEDGDVVFAGELSGHYYFPVFDFPWDDGVFAAALMARKVMKEDVLKKIEEFPEYPVSPEINLDCANEKKKEVMEKVAMAYSDHETSTMDGVKIQFEKGWGLVRPSSTEPKVRLRFEAETHEDLELMREEVEEEVRELIRDCS